MTRKVPLSAATALVLGTTGAIVCLLVMVGLWFVGWRIAGTADRAFEAADKLVANLGDRAQGMRQRLERAKINADDVAQALTTLAQQNVGQRIALQADVQQNVEHVSVFLTDAQWWIETSAAITDIIRQLMATRVRGTDVGDQTAAGRFLSEMESIRGRLDEAIRVAQELADRVLGLADEAASAERIEQASNLALRLVATVSELDVRLQQFENRTEELHEQLRRAQTRTAWWVLLGMLVATLMLAWMALGQFFMIRYGWTHRRARYGIEEN